MKPLSNKKRFIYRILFILLFFAFIPLLILYSSGYRFSDTLGLIRTGGIFISVPESGAEAYLDDVVVRQTGIFQRNVFVQNLKPGSYHVKIIKNGFQSWAKELQVFPQTVTEAHSFLLPEAPLLIEIPPTVSATRPNQSATSTATTSSVIAQRSENLEYVKVSSLFATSTPPNDKRKLFVENNKGFLRVSWEGSADSIPYYFCVSEVCQKEIVITPKSQLVSFDFFPGRDDLLILNLVDGIYLYEIDNRSVPNVQTLVTGKNLDFRVDNGIIYVKKDKQMYYINL